MQNQCKKAKKAQHDQRYSQRKKNKGENIDEDEVQFVEAQPIEVSEDAD